MLLQTCMKRPHFSSPFRNVDRLGVQTTIELATAGVLTAMLFRWIGV